MKKIIIFLMILLMMPLVQANYNQIRYKGKELGSVDAINEYMWETNQYEFQYYRKSLNRYWEDRIGDCTEIARVKYIMYKSIGLKSRISHGYIDGEKHDYTEYYYNYIWRAEEEDYTVRVGRGIW